MTASIESVFKRIAPAVDFCSFRFVEETTEKLAVQQNVPEPPQSCIDRGVMITVIDQGGFGYAATSDLSEAGLQAATARAHDWAKLTAGRGVVDYSKIAMPQSSGNYQSDIKQRPAAISGYAAQVAQ